MTLRRAVPWLLALLLPLGGCANLVVKKVPANDPEKDEHVKGFRYYLGRPYVIVKEPIFVAEDITLFVAGRELPPPPTQGETLPPPFTERAARVNGRTGALEPVSEEEWAALRERLRLDSGVQQATYRPAPAAAPVVNVQVNSPADAALPGGTYLDVDRASDKSAVAQSVRDTDPVKAPDVPTSDVRTVDLDGKIQVVFLPDMEEQYAVHNINVMAKSDYRLAFKDGWQLQGVSGSFDSTTVAVELLKTIDAAINAAKSVALGGIGGGGGGGASSSEQGRLAALQRRGNPLLERVTRTYVKPGMYRINKPWEMGEGCEAGAGFLVKLGLKTVTTVEWREPRQITRPEPPPVPTCNPPK
jgi:hypothetical protein